MSPEEIAEIEEMYTCKDCIKAVKEGYTMCGECSVPYCHAGHSGPSDCNCGPTPDND